MKIKYFAWIKDITKKDVEILNSNYPKNIEELKKYLILMYPSLEKHISKDILRYAINMEYKSKNASLQENDEIAVFPPVSGG
tara:strand:- start:1804 stop:2049 length:246 start_codon:yes stop_codon:yes gene_type:complete